MGFIVQDDAGGARTREREKARDAEYEDCAVTERERKG